MFLDPLTPDEMCRDDDDDDVSNNDVFCVAFLLAFFRLLSSSDHHHHSFYSRNNLCEHDDATGFVRARPVPKVRVERRVRTTALGTQN